MKRIFAGALALLVVAGGAASMAAETPFEPQRRNRFVGALAVDGMRAYGQKATPNAFILKDAHGRFADLTFSGCADDGGGCRQALFKAHVYVNGGLSAKGAARYNATYPCKVEVRAARDHETILTMSVPILGSETREQVRQYNRTFTACRDELETYGTKAGG